MRPEAAALVLHLDHKPEGRMLRDWGARALVPSEENEAPGSTRAGFHLRTRESSRGLGRMTTERLHIPSDSGTMRLCLI